MSVWLIPTQLCARDKLLGEVNDMRFLNQHDFFWQMCSVCYSHANKKARKLQASAIASLINVCKLSLPYIFALPSWSRYKKTWMECTHCLAKFGSTPCEEMIILKIENFRSHFLYFRQMSAIPFSRGSGIIQFLMKRLHEFQSVYWQ